MCIMVLTAEEQQNNKVEQIVNKIQANFLVIEKT